jgi:Animal haem peroxidase/RTX calcium-binding nonapeptide repeat (4 copies)
MVNFLGTTRNDDTTNIWSIAQLINNDLLNGDLGDDLLKGFAGNDTIDGGEGKDTLDGGKGNDSLNGDRGNDRIFGRAGNDFLSGGEGNDFLNGGSGNDVIYGDRFSAQNSNLDLDGNDSEALLRSADRIFGKQGNDLIFGQGGNDTIDGGVGNDSLNGDRGNDQIFGKAGNDFLSGGAGNDLLNGGKGDDVIYGDSFSAQNSALNSDGSDRILGGKGNDLIFGQGGNDTIDGGVDNDTIDGGVGDDTLKGQDGNDHLMGGDGNDKLYGGLGNDVLNGGLGNDTLNLGSGQDTVVLASGNGYDVVVDFKDGEDKIQLSGGLQFGNLAILSQGQNNTIIKNLLTGESLAKLKGVSSTSIEINDFVIKDASPLNLEFRSLDGSGNNLLNPNLGQAGNIYRRFGEANYGENGSIVSDLPNARLVSNVIFNDLFVNLFSENNASHLISIWGQFLDHTFGLAKTGTEKAGIAFDNNHPLEDFQNDFGVISFTRSEGVLVNGQREQINTVSSFIDGWSIYGGTEARLEWLREGVVDGDMSNNGAKLLLTDGYLPRADVRGDSTIAPQMALMGRLRAEPSSAIVAGDVRANENTGLTATHTLFAREHNRIVDLLPDYLDEETKFQIARKVVTAEQQYITYNEYLPSIGVDLDFYQGYDSTVDTSITNEFAAVGYRAHSMVHQDFEFDLKDVSDADLAILISQGATLEGDEIAIQVGTQAGNPSIINKIGLGNVFEGLFDHTYNNNEQIDNELRSLQFQIPQFGQAGTIQGFLNGVVDLGAIDIQRGRDHGILSYNDLREAFGLERVYSFYDITGEDPDAIKAFVDSEDLKNVDGTRITSADLIFDAEDLDLNDPHILDFIAILDKEGNLEADPQEIAELIADNEPVEGITAIRRSTIAARLEALYQDVDKVDAFTGMVSEQHASGTEFGELQLAMWKQQFEALRDGDRFFYLNDSDLAEIKTRFGISYELSFADLIANNTDLDGGDIPDYVFVAEQS